LRSALLANRDLLNATASRFKLQTALLHQPPPRRMPRLDPGDVDRFVNRAAALGIDRATAEAAATTGSFQDLVNAANKAEAATDKGSAKEVDTFERMIGGNDLLPFWFIALAERVARPVGRIVTFDSTGQLTSYATGFMISPRLLVTNNHVLPDIATARSAKVQFNYQADADGTLQAPVSFDLDPDTLFLTRPSTDLDYTIVAVRDAGAGASLSSFGFLRLTDLDLQILTGEPVNIIEHPEGKPKQIALRENKIIDNGLPHHLQYQTDTAAGSSGSPVFNDSWQLVAIHHSGIPRKNSHGDVLARDGSVWTPDLGESAVDWIANEGVRFSSIAADVQSMSLSAAQASLVAAVFAAGTGGAGDVLPSVKGEGGVMVPGSQEVSAGATVQALDGDVAVTVEAAEAADGAVSFTLQVRVRPGKPA
jgi:V8-like Glu-specific endopeptidase